MDEPHIAGRSPARVELEEGKIYAFCACGQSATQPFCDGSHAGSSMKPHVFTAERTETAFLCMCKRSGNIPFCDGTHSRLPAEDG